MMKKASMLLLVLLALELDLVQGLETRLFEDDKIMVKWGLNLINKPHIKSSQTKYGDILDCVEINKQYAFDHPLLQNHSLQLKPKFKVSKLTTSTGWSSTTLTPSDLIPISMRCPRGTVLVKRINEEDLAMEKFSSMLGMTFSTTKSFMSSVTPISNLDPGRQIATVVALTNNMGVSGVINVWSPDVLPEQLSDASAFVINDDGDVSNAIQAGWSVYPYLLQNYSRLYAYWTKDSGKSTGCFNALCPGFVQVSQNIALGVILQPLSTYWGPQTFITISIQQDQDTKNWWLFFGNEHVGYWPKELFSTLTNGAARAGWGGEVYSTSTTEGTPAMGSGHFPEEGYSKACLICRMNLVGPQSFPNATYLKVGSSKPDCYKATYDDVGGDFGHLMFVGGPPNCKLS